MAQRTVSIRIQLDGYQEYRNTIAMLNSQNKLLDAQLKSIDQQYGRNSRSTEAIAAKQEILARQEATYRAKLAETERMLGNATNAQGFYLGALEQAQRDYDAAAHAIDEYNNGTYTGTENLEQLQQAENNAAQALTDAMRNYTQATNEVARLTQERNNETQVIDDLVNKQQELVNGMHEEENENEKVGSSLNWTIDAWQMTKDIIGKVTEELKKIPDSVKACIDAFTNYEAAFTNVTKTVDGTDQQLDHLNKQIKEMSATMPYAAADIANIASLAGQLGIKVDDIADFTEVMLGLGTATNITADDAATMIAQFQNVTGFPIDKVKNIASVIVDLGNNTATTENDIMRMAQRFASAGTLAGLSASDLLGMSAALSSVGIEAEAGGTSLSKMTQKIQSAVEGGGDDLETFARIAGTSAENFAKAWKESPVEAINMFFAGMKDTYEEGDSVLELLDDIGFKEVRLRNATQALAVSEKDLSYYVDMANNAFDTTTAYDTEVNRFLGTTQSNTQILKNNFELLKIEIGENLSPAWNGLIDGVGHLVEGIMSIIEANGWLIQGISAVIGFMADVAYGIGEILTKNKEYIGDVERFGQVAVNTQQVIGDSTKEYARQTQAIEDTVEQADEYLGVLDRLGSDGKVTKEEQEEYNEAIEKLKELFPELNIEVDKHTGLIKGGTDAIREQIDAWKDNAIAEAQTYRMTQLYKQLYDAQDELTRNTKELKDDRRQLERTNKQLSDAEAEYSKYYERNVILTKEEKERKADLEEQIKTLKKEKDDLNQKIADEEVAVIADRDAIIDCETSIKNWEKVIEGATDTTEEFTEAIEDNSEAYDQSDEAAKSGKKTIAAYVDGQLTYFTSDEWKAYRQKVEDEEKGIFRTAGSDAYNKGMEIMKNFANGILDSKSQVKAAGQAINDQLASTLRKNNYTFKMKVQNGTATYVAQFAKGGVVTSAMPAIVGEAGAEAIIPLKKLPDIMTQIMANQESMDGYTKARGSSTASELNNVVSLLNKYLPSMANMQVVLDSNKMVGTLAPKMDTYFSNQLMAEGRGQ